MNNKLDNCEVCHGKSGGVRGNENVIDGVVMCDYCHVKDMDRKRDEAEIFSRVILDIG